MPSVMASRGRLSLSAGSFILILIAAVIFNQERNSFCHGFAYAPNFITKIIQEDTGTLDPKVQSADGGVEEIQDDDESDSSLTTLPTLSAVKTRFPPEPNGYLHLGHAKAVSFNFAVARMFEGTCNMRMDDTNPTKEDEEYVESILEDVKWIQSGLYEGDIDGETNDEATPWEGNVRKTSSYFDIIYECAEALILSGDAYVDSLSAEEMREYRGTLTEPGKDSPFRSRSQEESLELFRKVCYIRSVELMHFGMNDIWPVLIDDNYSHT